PPRPHHTQREPTGCVVVPNGSTGAAPAGQLRRFREELMFADLEIVSNRIDKLRVNLRKPRPQKEKDIDQAELDLLQRIATALESNQSPATLGLKEDEEKSIRSFQLLTLKPEQPLLNVGDDSAGKPLPADLLTLAPTALKAPAKLEMELHELGDEDRQMFMQDLGLTGFVRDDVLRSIF